MKQKKYCDKCESSQHNELEKIMACPILTPEEKASIIQNRHYKNMADEFSRKYGVKTA